MFDPNKGAAMDPQRWKNFVNTQNQQGGGGVQRPPGQMPPVAPPNHLSATAVPPMMPPQTTRPPMPPIGPPGGFNSPPIQALPPQAVMDPVKQMMTRSLGGPVMQPPQFGGSFTDLAKLFGNGFASGTNGQMGSKPMGSKPLG